MEGKEEVLNEGQPIGLIEALEVSFKNIIEVLKEGKSKTPLSKATIYSQNGNPAASIVIGIGFMAEGVDLLANELGNAMGECFGDSLTKSEAHLAPGQVGIQGMLKEVVQEVVN